MKAKEHHIKCYPAFFRDLHTGAKKFEIRKNDRNYETGDIVYLYEYYPNKDMLTGEYLKGTIGYTVHDYFCKGLKKGYICFEFKLILAGTASPSEVEKKLRNGKTEGQQQ